MSVRNWPMQQIKIEIIGAETAKARFTSTCHGPSSDVIGFYLGDHEGAVTLAGNHALNQFFGTAFTVIPRCVNQSHPERKTRAQRFFFVGCRMSSLADMPRALTDRRDSGAVAKLDGARCAR